jgi:hypothetical protein
MRSLLRFNWPDELQRSFGMFLDNLKNRWRLNKSELISVLAPGILISSIIFLFGPFVIYSGNVSEFRVSLIDILKYYAIPGFVLLAVFLSIGMALSKKYVKLYVSVIFAIGVLMWLQGNIFVWKYGLLDGHAFDWTKDQWRGWVDGSLWLLLLAFSSFFYKTVYRFAILGSIALICLQTMYLGFNSFQRSEIWKSGVSQDYVTPKGIYEFSSKRNVIQFILDAFQSDIFQDIINEDLDYYNKALEGFTFFRETTGSFPTTYMSVPAILSGINYKNHIPMQDFVKLTLNGKTISNVLYDKGYEVDLVHGGGRRYFEGRFSNAFWPGRLYGKSKYQNRDKAAFLMDLVLFRYVPHFLKPLIYNDQSWLIQRISRWNYGSQLIFSHRAFLEDLIANMTPNRKNPVYKFIHIMTTHSPLVIDENCEYAGKVLPFTRKNLNIQQKCGLDDVIGFFEKLKFLGIYDSSLIVLQADHGAGVELAMKGTNDELDSDGFISGDYLTRVAASALPLLAIKPPHSNGPLKISNAQAMLTDIPATINSILNLNERFPGMSVFDLDSEEVRDRKTYYYTWQKTNWQDNYFYRLDEYIINGSVFDRSSWRLGARYNTPENNLYETEKIDFGSPGVERFFLNGWGGDESDSKVGLTFNWALRTPSSIVVSLPKNESVCLTANVRNFLKSQTVSIIVDRKEIGTWELSPFWKWEKMNIAIPPDDKRPDVSVVEFVFSQHRKAKANEKDKRPLAVLFESIRLSKTNNCK